jgi:hypothetical protein
VRAVELSGAAFNLLLLGDGPLAAQVRNCEKCLPVRCVDSINQAEIPRWYATGDILARPGAGRPGGCRSMKGWPVGWSPWSAMLSVRGWCAASAKSFPSATPTRWQQLSPRSQATPWRAGADSVTG